MDEDAGSEEVAELRRELSVARCWAWGAHHRTWNYRWFPEAWRPGDGEWNLPEWLSTSDYPDRQPWFVDPDAPPALSAPEARPSPAGDAAFELVPDLTGVRVLHDHVVEVSFADGVTGIYDFAGRLTGPAFAPVREDYAVFRAVRLSTEGGTIVWPVGDDPDAWPDWSPDELYRHVAANPGGGSRP